jgi:1,4-dihydroxy-2-naphthoyl-CoA synthase
MPPFFSEAYLYELVGKEEARTILALLRKLLAAGGLSMDDAHEALATREAEEKAARKARELKAADTSFSGDKKFKKKGSGK